MTEQQGTVLNIHKPADYTSFDVVREVRDLTGVRKVGHAGTLDPFATGVLLILVGRGATRRFEEFMQLPKTYRATFRFGWISDTLDSTGEFLQQEDLEVKEPELRKILPEFTGTIEQIPPMYSAKKVDGQRLYKLARQGKEVERKPSRVTVYSLDLLALNNSECRFEISCSKGTYIRALARDIGERYGTGACVTELVRTAIGSYTLDDAISLNNLEEKWNSIAA